MKNKILISITLVASFNIAQAEYSAKIFIDGLSFKNEIQTPVIPPSTNCLFDQDNNIWAISNISDSTNGMGIIMGETMAFYNEKVIGVDSATKDFPTGLSLGQLMMDVGSYRAYEICADDFSIYPDITSPPPSYTYNEISIPNGSIGITTGSNGYQIFGFVQYNTTMHPTLPDIGNPISNGNGNRLMLEIYEYNSTFKAPIAVIYIVSGNERINDTFNPGNIETWWNQYDRAILSNSDESFKIEIPLDGGALSNWDRSGTNMTPEQLQQITNNPNIITKIKFRNKQ